LLQDHIQMVYMTEEKSLEMKNFSFKSSGLIKNDSQEYRTICDWLRQIHGQNTRLLNLFKVLQNEILQSSSPLGEPSLDIPDLEDK